MAVELHLISPGEPDEYTSRGVQVFLHSSSHLPVGSLMSRDLAEALEATDKQPDPPPGGRWPPVRPPYLPYLPYRTVLVEEADLAEEIAAVLADSGSDTSPRLAVTTELADRNAALDRVLDMLATSEVTDGVIVVSDSRE